MKTSTYSSCVAICAVRASEQRRAKQRWGVTKRAIWSTTTTGAFCHQVPVGIIMATAVLPDQAEVKTRGTSIRHWLCELIPLETVRQVAKFCTSCLCDRFVMSNGWKNQNAQDRKTCPVSEPWANRKDYVSTIPWTVCSASSCKSYMAKSALYYLQYTVILATRLLPFWVVMAMSVLYCQILCTGLDHRLFCWPRRPPQAPSICYMLHVLW